MGIQGVDDFKDKGMINWSFWLWMRLHGRALAKHVEALLHPLGRATKQQSAEGTRKAGGRGGGRGRPVSRDLHFKRKTDRQTDVVKYTFEPGENSICEYCIFNTISKTLNLDKTM